uniref:uncharacterized protein LOC120330861 n=1 Tax=Styela clava TaxID=7725 RepID=UPI001939ED0E|nr:uncharacterized protein LOC120330861 [Styela clava]
MASSMTEIVTSPVAKHRKSAFGFEPSYEKRWDSVMQLQTSQKKTPHRYQQSPVFSRKVHSCPSEKIEPKHHHHRRRHHTDSRRHHTESRRHHAVSESDKSDVTCDERVHLLSSLPWRKSTDSDSSSNSSNDDLSSGRNFGGYSPFFSRRLDDNLERERTRSVSATSKPLFLRRGKQRARSQGSSPIPQRKYEPGIPPISLAIPNYANQGNSHMSYKTTMHIENQKASASSPGHVLSPIEDPVTPQAGTTEFITVPMVHVTGEHLTENHVHHSTLVGANNPTGFLQVPPLDGSGSHATHSPHTLRKFLGLQTEEIPPTGLTETDILQSRLLSRRFSSSSESSTSTLT